MAGSRPLDAWTVAEAARIQGRVIGALILREMQTRSGRRNLGYLWAVFEPLLYISLFIVIFQFIGRRQAVLGMDMAPFFASGVLPFLLFRSTVTPLDLILARAILEAATYVIVMVAMAGGLAAFGLGPVPHSLLGLVGVMALAPAMGLAVIIQFIVS